MKKEYKSWEEEQYAAQNCMQPDQLVAVGCLIAIACGIIKFLMHLMHLI